MKKWDKSIVIAVAALLGSNGVCEEVNFGKHTPTVNQVIDALKGREAVAHSDAATNQFEVDVGAQRRSLNIGGPNTSEKPKFHHPERRPAQSENALSIEVLFDYDSAELKPDAINRLKPVGKALASNELDRLSFIVEGHTDASGSDQYNYNLSRQRSEAVKHFLVGEFDLDPSLLEVVGRGEKGLIDPANPTSEVNRRVRFVTQ